MKNDSIKESFTKGSSNINEGFRAVLFLRKVFTCTKAQKHRSTKSTKRKQATFIQTIYTRIKSIKSTKSIKNTERQTSDFLPLRCFYAYKNSAFFCFSHKKAQKVHKKHKNANKRISDYFPLRCFLEAFFIFVCL